MGIFVGRSSIAAAVSLCAALVTWSLSRWFQPSTQVVRSRWAIRQSLLLPGLAGSLLLSLASAALFQLTCIRSFYDTPIPWLLALIVWLLPRAVLVRLWLATITQTEAVHLAEMLTASGANAQGEPLSGARNPPAWTLARADFKNQTRRGPSQLLFRLRDLPQLLAIGLLSYWAYLDLSTAYLLAPSGMPSGLVRLYNFMHFGRSSALSAEAFLFFGVPVLAIVIAANAWGAVRRRR